MCGRFTLKTPVMDWLISLFPHYRDSLQSLATELQTRHPSMARSRFNIAPTQSVWVVVQPSAGGSADSSQDRPDVRCMRWGLVPAWADSLQVAYAMINARAETIREKPSFKHLMNEHRCIVVADGYYEWQRPAETAPPGVHKQPYWIHRPQEQPFAMAGLWTENRRIQPNGIVQSTTLITTHANADTQGVHDRMPVVLQEPVDVQRWLALDMPPESIDDLLLPAREGFFQVRAVSDRVNSPRHEGPELIEDTGK